MYPVSDITQVMKEAWSTLFMGIVALIVASAVSAWMTVVLSPMLLSAEQLSPSRVEVQARALGIEMIDPSAMRVIVETSSHLILDARSQSDYDEAAIPTALSLPVKDFENSFPLIAPMLTPDTPLVVYCGGPLCDDALQLIGRLNEAGFVNTSLFLQGMEGWE